MNNSKGVILIVDDEKEITMSLKGFFTAIGYDMLATLDGSEAMKIIDSVTLDLIILDVRMPGINGIQILKKVRKEKPQTKVIIITAYDKENKAEVEKIGIDGFFPKPIDLSKLLDRIRYVLETTKDTRAYPTKKKPEEVSKKIPKAKFLFLEPNPIVFGFTCGFFASNEVIPGEYETKVEYVTDAKGLNPLYDFSPDIVIMYESLYNMEDTKQLAGMMMNSSHKPKVLIIHGFFPKTELELKELEKMGIKYCNQNAMDDEELRVSNKKLADFVAKECVKYGLIK